MFDFPPHHHTYGDEHVLVSPLDRDNRNAPVNLAVAPIDTAILGKCSRNRFVSKINSI